MEKFETVVGRHGETGVQAILDNWERFAGVQYMMPVSLEKRWTNFMHATATQPQKMAA